jgi:phosphoribosyl 1,2-cyclic phosphodiesterase
MKLTFHGTRGYIEARRRGHRRHTCTEVAYRGRSVLLDFGADWRGRAGAFDVSAVLLTHAHPDHAWGLWGGAPAPVYATAESWQRLADCPLPQRRRRTLAPRRAVRLGGLSVTAFPVVHSTRAPAVGYRIEAGRKAIFYVPDVVYIEARSRALGGADLYVGDGAALEDSLVRKAGGHLVGHTPIRTQLTWCAKEGVPEAVFTHCGSRIVTGDERRLRPRLQRLARERGVRAAFARDGQQRVLR